MGFNLLREMELVGEDEVVSDEETEDHDIVFESEQLNLEVQYDSNFPALRAANESKKWGPVQAARMSSRIAGDKRTIMEKAQQLKKVQNLEVHKTHGKKQASFNLFNNPSFLSVASNIGVEVDLADKCLTNPSTPIGSSRVVTTNMTEGHDNEIGEVLADHIVTFDPSSSPNEGLLSLVCRNRWGKHPRTEVIK